MAAPVATTWGFPTASKRVLLIHGVGRSSQFWNNIAQDFASRGESRLPDRVDSLQHPDISTGYFVIAPDLLNHGHAKRSSEATFAAFAEELRPWFSMAPWGRAGDAPYDIVVGHLFGGILTAALLPHLASARPVRVVLVDPSFELTPESAAKFRQTLTERVRNPQTPEALLEQNPHWTKKQAVVESASAHLCDVTVATIEAFFDENVPFSFSHLLSKTPDNVKVTALVADPSKDPRAKEEHLEAPHVTVKTVWGAVPYTIPIDWPEVVVEAALEGAE